MLQTTTIPLSKGSLHSCTFKRIPDETRFHVVDPNVIQKVESSGKYILTYKEPDTTYLNIHELRKEMGSPNLDLCTEERILKYLMMEYIIVIYTAAVMRKILSVHLK